MIRLTRSDRPAAGSEGGKREIQASSGVHLPEEAEELDTCQPQPLALFIRLPLRRLR